MRSARTTAAAERDHRRGRGAADAAHAADGVDGADGTDRTDRTDNGPMARRRPNRSDDLRGAARLATEATVGLTDLVEALHERIARLPGVPAPLAAGRTRGLTGLVYQTIRGVARATGGSVDAVLGLLGPARAGAGGDPQADVASTPTRDALVAALNGVIGDHLAASGNPLAIAMALHHDGRALPADARSLAAALPQAGGTVVVMLHGLCMHPASWTRDGRNHGLALAQATQGSALFVHCNSGLAVAVNGRALADRLEQLVDAWPQPLTRLVLVGHSMGGLIARSALHHGQRAGHRWPARVSDFASLGTPHLGAPLERAGHGIDLLLAATPYAAPLARLGRLRSAGIRDLRLGNLLDAEATAAGAAAPVPRTVPLPDGVRCHAIAASLSADPSTLKGRLLGDGLVPLDSALGRHRDPARRLAFDVDRQWVAGGLGHLDLLGDAAVQARLLQWLAPGTAG